MRKFKKRVREVIYTRVWCAMDFSSVYAYLDLNSPRLRKKDWIDGDRVRVTVERLPRKRKGKA